MSERKWTVTTDELAQKANCNVANNDNRAADTCAVGLAICERLEAILEALGPLTKRAEREERLEQFDLSCAEPREHAEAYELAKAADLAARLDTTSGHH